MNRLNLELLDIINPYINYESKSLQIRGSEVVEKIIKTNIVERYTFFRCKENVRKLIVEKCSAFKTTKCCFANITWHTLPQVMKFLDLMKQLEL